MADLIKNERVRNNATGTILFNPYLTIESVYINPVGIDLSDIIFENTYSAGLAYVHEITIDGNNWSDISVSTWDTISFDGQVVGFAYKYQEGLDYKTGVVFPVGTFDYSTSLDISGMIKPYGYMDFFKSIFTDCDSEQVGYAFIGTSGTEQVGDISIISDENAVRGVLIIDHSVVKNAASYGHHSRIYNSKNTYKGVLKLPYKTSIGKIKQILESDGLVFLFDDRNIDSIYEIPDGNKIVKPLGGGSINPIGRQLTIVSNELKEVVRRDFYSLEVIFEG